MTKAYVYILKSEKYSKTYVGSTIDLDKRIRTHNAGLCYFTSRYKPWELCYKEERSNLVEARKREKYLKSCAGRKFIAKLFDNIAW
jgi:putative endonuclease